MITVLSFGFKYGIPVDSDLVFDVRFLPNPFYIPELKKYSGNDKLVADYIMGFDQTGQFIDKLSDMLEVFNTILYQRGKKTTHYIYRMYWRKT